MEFHEIANVFPLVKGQDFIELCNDIKANGQLATIVLYEGKILDGRNRWRACEAVGVKPRTTDFEGDYEAAIRMVISLNLRRRHMGEQELALAAADVANLAANRPKKETAGIPAVKQSAAAEMFGVTRDAVQQAAVVRDHAVPAVREAVRSDAVIFCARDRKRARYAVWVRSFCSGSWCVFRVCSLVGSKLFSHFSKFRRSWRDFLECCEIETSCHAVKVIEMIPLFP